MSPRRNDSEGRTSRDKSYEKRHGSDNFKKTPHSIYFYYLRKWANDDSPYVRNYFIIDKDSKIEPHGTGPRGLKARIVNLVRNARKDEEDQNPPPNGKDMEFIVWYQKSHIVIAVDDAGYQFARENGIITEEGGVANHSLFDANDYTVDIDGKPCAIFACMNHMKRNSGGDNLEDGVLQRIPFKINPKPSFLSERIRYPDDGGSNLGPPVPPP